MSTDFDRVAAACNATDEQMTELRRVANDVGRDEPSARFATGGYVNGPLPRLTDCVLTIDPDECMVGGDDVRAGRLVCSRPGHPTARSNCSTAPQTTAALDGATERGPDNAYPSTPGEFAARWNSWTDEQRSEWLIATLEAADEVDRCRVLHQPRQDRPLKPVARDAQGEH